MARVNSAVWLASIVLACAGTVEAAVDSSVLGASQSDDSAVSAAEATVTRCVRTADGLRAALAAAAANGKHDVIRLTQGTYYGPFVYESTEAFDLGIEGGYTANCASRVVNPVNTVLDGWYQTEPEPMLRLTTEQAANFVVEGLNVQNSNRGASQYYYWPALTAQTAGEIVLNRSVVGPNYSGPGAALFARSVRVENATIVDNWAWGSTDSGIEIYAQKDVVFRGNEISGNWAYFFGEEYNSGIVSIGGAGKVIVANNRITRNDLTSNYDMNGEQLGFGHCISVGGHEVVFVSNLVAGNAQIGGAQVGGSDLYVVNNTIVGNWCWGCRGGLSISHHGAQAWIYNNIIVENWAAPYFDHWDGSWVDVYGGNLYISSYAEGAQVNLFNNDFPRPSYYWWHPYYDPVTFIWPPFPIDPSNLDVDPLFVDWHCTDPGWLGDCHLQPTSPVINMGSNAAPKLPVRDLDGNPRIRLSTVDMGAYEAPNPAPSAPRNPSPANGATNVSLEPTLTWTQGTRATSHDVYFGTTSSPPLVRNTDGTSFRTGTLTTNTTYYWRIVARNDFGTASSPTWSFKTGNLGATAPSPANGASGVSLTPTLTWKAGLGATSYDVYFGTTSSPPKVGSVTGTSYNPGTLATNKTYCWKVVTRMGSNSLSSPIWTFKTK